MTTVGDLGRAEMLARRSVSRETLALLDAYAERLLRWQQTTNLVSPSTVDALWTRHFEDSLILCDHLPATAGRIVDLGSGGGLPGVVVAITGKTLGSGTVALVESNGKKAAFLRLVARELDLPAEIHAVRVEVAGPVIAAADLVTARALAPLDALFGFVGDHLRSDSVCLFPKGENHEGEIVAASARWDFDMVKHSSPAQPGSVILEVRRLERRR